MPNKFNTLEVSSYSPGVCGLSRIFIPLTKVITGGEETLSLDSFKISKRQLQKIMYHAKDMKTICLGYCILDTENLTLPSIGSYKTTYLSFWDSGDPTRSDWINNPDKSL
ncbi:unnamed protein product [Moneuplotes crassus]|uniref:Uncharacterized protein n=1 Tax=Euplotes crassus TaxID=5936 RepID=A0AAD1TZ23_EUPCR|nr:unnamed protein product [Moneuplotes crassus]